MKIEMFAVHVKYSYIRMDGCQLISFDGGSAHILYAESRFILVFLY